MQSSLGHLSTSRSIPSGDVAGSAAGFVDELVVDQGRDGVLGVSATVCEASRRMS